MKRSVFVVGLLSLVTAAALLLVIFTRECEHEFSEEVTQAATCAEEGVLTKTCTKCDEIVTEPIPLSAHIFGEETFTREPTCKDPGAVYTQCTVCAAENIVEHIAKTDDHTFENQVLRAPTCVDPGEGNDVCAVCGLTQACTYDLAEHKYDSGVVTAEPTCAEEGTRQYRCTACDHTRSEAIGALGHKWAELSCYGPVTCSVCGYVNYDGTGHNYVLVEERSASAHFIGIKYYECTGCGSRYQEYTDFDLEEIKYAAESYAASLGFTVIQSDRMPDGNRWEFSKDVFHTNLHGGQAYLVQSARNMVDSMYKTALESPAGPSVYDFWIIVEYVESGAVGGGSFWIYAFLF